jgi:hypothetical protein
MGIYLNKWSGELQLELKEGCVHGTWMPPLLTNSWIFFYLIKAYHKFYNTCIFERRKRFTLFNQVKIMIINKRLSWGQ